MNKAASVLGSLHVDVNMALTLKARAKQHWLDGLSTHHAGTEVLRHLGLLVIVVALSELFLQELLLFLLFGFFALFTVFGLLGLILFLLLLGIGSLLLFGDLNDLR